MRAVLVAVVVLAGASGVSASAAAAAWSPPTRISPMSSTGAVASYSQIATDARRDGTAVWDQSIGRGGVQVIMASERRAGSHAWSRPRQVSSTDLIFNGLPAVALSPVVAVDSAGGAVLAWQTPAGVQAAFRRTASGKWSKPVTLSPSGTGPESPVVGIDAHGHATAVWSEQTGSTGASLVQSSSLTIAGGRWSKPIDLASSSKLLTSTQLAVNPSGEIVAVWEKWLSGSIFGPSQPRIEVYATVRRSATAEWERAVSLGAEAVEQYQLTGNTEVAGPQVALDAKGDVIVVWQRGSGKQIITAVAVRKAGASRWRSEKPPSSHGALWPDVASSPSGNATVIWQSGSTQVSAASSNIVSGSWSAPVNFSTRDHGPSDFRVAVSDSGTAILGWGEDGDPIHFAVRNTIGGSWQRPISRGSANAGSPSIAFAPTGRADVLWTQPGKAVGPGGQYADIWIDSATYSPTKQ